jgi:hypothetical protein
MKLKYKIQVLVGVIIGFFYLGLIKDLKQKLQSNQQEKP